MSRKKRDNTRWLSTALTAIIVISVFTVGTVPVSARVASVIRDLPDGPVGTDEEIVVSLTQTGFFLGEGCVKETLPDDFTYVDESLTGNAHMGVDYTEENELIYTEENELIISFDGETTVTYSVRTSSYAQSAEFEGRYFTISELGEERGPVEGDVTTNVTEVVATATIAGNVREVNCAILPGATVELFKDTTLIDTDTTDENGNYTLSASETDGYTVTVSKSGYVSETQGISITAVPGEYTLDFVSNDALVPEDPSMSYVLECINHWTVPPSQVECQIDMSKVLAVINAWVT